MVFFLFLVFAGAIAWAVITANNKATALETARAAYETSLAQLKRAPSDPNLRQRTLALGRAYSNLTRQGGGVTVYDEVALSNDINAACAGAQLSPPPHVKAPIETRLERLSDLRNRGVLSDEEYAAERRRVLDDL